MRRIYILAILCLLGCMASHAAMPDGIASANDIGKFVSITAKDAPIGDELPLFTTQIEAGRGVTGTECEVRVEYPEYVRLSADEARALKRLAPKLGTDVKPEYRYTVERRRGVIDVALVPLVKRGGTYYRLVSCKLAVYGINADKASVTPGLKTRAAGNDIYNKVQGDATDGDARYAEHSVLATGKWVKIRVDKEGVYSLSKSFLAQAGFSDASRVKLYGYGGLMQDSVITYTGANRNYDDLHEIPLYRNGGQTLFFAEGTTKWRYVNGIWRHVNNPYSAYSYYFLTEGDAPAAMSDAATSPVSTESRTEVTACAVYDDDAFSWYAGGQRFFDRYDFANGNTHTYQLSTPDVVSGSTARVTVAFTAAHAAATTDVTTEVNATKLGAMTIPILNNSRYGEQGNRAKLMERTYSTTALSATNDVRFTTTAGHAARLDYISITYRRSLNLSSPYIIMCDAEHKGEGTYAITATNADTRVWRIGTAAREQQNVPCEHDGSTLRVTLPEASDRYVVVNTAANFPTPTVVEHVKNQDLHADEAYDMVVIIPKSGKLAAQAQRLVNAHIANDSLRVRLVRADEIYNEFSSGTPDAMAYRRYMKMLYDRAASEADMPKYLLLFGDAAWDNRMVTQEWKNSSPDDYLLCYESWNSTNEIACYVTDDFFGVLDDGEGRDLTTEKLDLYIGRFPVRTESEAKVMVDKTIAYMNNATVGSWKNLICMMGDDDKESNSLMSDAESIASWIERNKPGFNVRRVYWDAYKVEKTSTGNAYPQITKELKNYMTNGALVMNYTGHGAPSSVSHEKVLLLNDFKTSKTKNPALWIFSSCEITPFDSQEETIGEAALLNPHGGAMAFISATRAVYSTRNKYLNTFLMQNLLSTDGTLPMPMGKALTKAKCLLVTSTSSSDKTINKLKYVLTGDPALRLMTPTNRVVIDSINGRSTADGNVKLPAGSVARVSGHIVNAAGQPMNDYTGAVTATVYDKKERITCYDNAGNGLTPYSFYDRTRRLFEGTDSITNGRFTFSFPVSMDASYSNETCLMSMYAVSSTHGDEANGYNDAFSINSAESLDNDTIGPAMYIYLNNPDFKDGGKTNLAPYFVAYIEDNAGINATGSGVGHDLELIIDGNPATSYILNDYYTNEFGTYTKGRVHFAIPELEPGNHRLIFRAWDMLGNSSSQMLNFVAVRGLKPTILDMTCSPNPATESTEMLITYDRPECDMKFRVEVFDMLGRIVYTNTVEGDSSNGFYPIEWNLTNSSGARLPGGVYLYRVSVAEKDGRASSKTKKLIILNNK